MEKPERSLVDELIEERYEEQRRENEKDEAAARASELPTLLRCETCEGRGLVPASGEAGEFGATECCPDCESHTWRNSPTGHTYAKGSGLAIIRKVEGSLPVPESAAAGRAVASSGREAHLEQGDGRTPLGRERALGGSSNFDGAPRLAPVTILREIARPVMLAAGLTPEEQLNALWQVVRHHSKIAQDVLDQYAGQIAGKDFNEYVEEVEDDLNPRERVTLDTFRNHAKRADAVLDIRRLWKDRANPLIRATIRDYIGRARGGP